MKKLEERNRVANARVTMRRYLTRNDQRFTPLVYMLDSQFLSAHSRRMASMRLAQGVASEVVEAPKGLNSPREIDPWWGKCEDKPVHVSREAFLFLGSLRLQGVV